MTWTKGLNPTKTRRFVIATYDNDLGFCELGAFSEKHVVKMFYDLAMLNKDFRSMEAKIYELTTKTPVFENGLCVDCYLPICMCTHKVINQIHI